MFARPLISSSVLMQAALGADLPDRGDELVDLLGAAAHPGDRVADRRQPRVGLLGVEPEREKPPSGGRDLRHLERCRRRGLVEESQLAARRPAGAEELRERHAVLLHRRVELHARTGGRDEPGPDAADDERGTPGGQGAPEAPDGAPGAA
jgi:hypothetical protein